MCMERSVKILLLEDNLYDAELIQYQISKNTIKHQFKHVSEFDDFIRAINEYIPDIILSDFNLVGFTGLDALEFIKQKGISVPFIIVTGTLNEETAADTIKNGAWDYVVKERLTRLNTAIKNALQLKDEKEKRAIDREKLKLSEERFKLAIEGSQDGIWDWNLKTNKVYFSSHWKSMLGYEDHEIVNDYSTWVDLLHPDDAEYALNELDKHLKKETLSYKVEFRMKCKDGVYKWIFAKGKAMFDQNGNAYRIAGSHTDMSERKLMERKLIEAKEKAEESDRLKTAFLQNISHEIRTPMNGICGFVDLLTDSQLSEDKINKYISLIKNCSVQLLGIVNDLVDISIIEAGQITLGSDIVSVNTMLFESVSLHKPLAAERNIQLNLDRSLSDQVDSILIDRSKLQQILNNLIKNAIKFTPQGIVNIGAYVKNSEIVFFVEDTGIGIKPEFQEKIFERFFQEERSGEQFMEGTGLGLAISKAFIEEMGGKLWLESELNSGTTFYFSFPYKAIQAKQIDSEQGLNGTT